MKMALKYKNDKFLVTRLRNVLTIMGLENLPGTPKLFAIANENGHKRKNDKFSVMRLKNVLSVMGLIKLPGNPKL
jgi:hypothetical protein